MVQLNSIQFIENDNVKFTHVTLRFVLMGLQLVLRPMGTEITNLVLCVGEELANVLIQGT